MRPAAPTRIALATLVLTAILAFAGAASAQYVPSPGTNDLGISENDVRPEPNHPDDVNGFQDADPFWSPAVQQLVLDAYVEYGTQTSIEDYNAVLNNLLHGNNRDAYESYMAPGPHYFEAWWGYWADKGGGGDLQQNEQTADLAIVGEPNGAIDDFTDQKGGQCRSSDDPAWDEFVWRGGNMCGEEAGAPDANQIGDKDRMLAFVQPGTHNMHMNSIVPPFGNPSDPPFHNHSDSNQVPDVQLGYDKGTETDPAGSELWAATNGFARVNYDQSLLMTTQVATAVNPEQVGPPVDEDPGLFDDTQKFAHYDPDNPEGPEDDPGEGQHAIDVDLYANLHPAAEDAYRAAVWDPPQDYGDDEDEQNVGALHEEGVKEFLKHDAHEVQHEVLNTVLGNVNDATESAEPAQGFADDLLFGPYKHEPNTADDDYAVDTDGDGADDTTLATFDAATSYGGLEGSYYDPGAGQTYPGYQNQEHFWVDAQLSIESAPIWALYYVYGPGSHFTPELAGTSDPVTSLSEEDDDNTFGPSITYIDGHAGTWHDANGDTFVGNAGQSGDPYDNGTDDTPNDYSSGEWNGAKKVDWKTLKLVPTRDTDGDGVGEWGSTGVYVFGEWDDGNPYSDFAMDVVGDAASPILTPLRGNDNVGGVASYAAPQDEDGRLSRYRTEGPIEMRPVVYDGINAGTGTHYATRAVVFPTGSYDAPFKVVATAELTADRTADAPGNAGQSLMGETITDVDVVNAIDATDQ